MVSLSAQGEERIQSILSEAAESKRTPGLVFGATSAERDLCLACAGTRIIDDPSSGAVTPDSVLWICSQSKLIVSIATFQLIEAGKLHFDTPVASVMPELEDPVIVDPDPTPGKPGFRPAKEVMRVRHLLNHTSGLSYPPESERLEPYATRYGQENPVGQFYDLLKGDYPAIPLRYEPGTSFSYGWSSDTLGFIVERVSGQSLEEYYKEHIFAPLAITASFYLTPDLQARLVSFCFRKPDGDVVPWSSIIPEMPMEQDPEKVNIHMAGTGLYFTMRDYLALLRHLLQILAGTAENPILKPASLQTFFRPNLNAAGEEALRRMSDTLRGIGDSWSTALCVNTVDIPGKRRKGSGWWYGWAGTYHFVDPETGVAAFFGSQLVPTRDGEVIKLWDQVEEALYAGLSA